MRFRIVLIGLQNIRIFGVMLRRKLAAAANLNTILKRRLHRCKRRVMTQFPTVVGKPLKKNRWKKPPLAMRKVGGFCGHWGRFK